MPLVYTKTVKAEASETGHLCSPVTRQPQVKQLFDQYGILAYRHVEQRGVPVVESPHNVGEHRGHGHGPEDLLSGRLG